MRSQNVSNGAIVAIVAIEDAVAAMELNRQQQRAIDIRRNCVVVAPPGSGKTRTGTEKIVARVREGVEPARLGAVTFTRAAASELRERLEARIGSAKAKKLTVGTFHSIAGDQLTRVGWRLKLLAPAQRMRLYQQLRAQFKERYRFDELAQMVELCKAQVAPLEDGSGEAYDVARAYQRLLREANAFDFQDLIRESVKGMKADAIDPLPLDELIVDEYQDADPIQHEWTLIHARAGVTITAVGDDDQSIYGWRNAMGYHGMAGLAVSLDAELVHLSTNYRSLPAILTHAERIVRCNQTRLDKTITTYREGQGEVALLKVADSEEEARGIASLAQGLDGQLAVLARTNAYLDAVERHLAFAGVAYKRENGRSVFSRDHVALFLQLLDFIARADRRVLDHLGPLFGFDLRGWRRYAMANDLPADPGAFVRRYKRYEPDADPPEPLVAFWALADLVSEWREAMAYEDTIPIYGAEQYFLRHVDETSLHQEIRQLARELIQMEGDLGQRVEALRDAVLASKAMTSEEAHVRLMTIHRAKGLEFPVVWVPGLSHEVMPNKDSELEEERRLLYVAMTRAEERLIMSYPEKIKPSRFVDELRAAEVPEHALVLQKTESAERPSTAAAG